MKERVANPTKNYHCEICGRDFARLEHLKRHTTTHTNEKSFRCFCGKSFARRDLLKRHEQIGKHLTVNFDPRGSCTLAPTVPQPLAAPTQAAPVSVAIDPVHSTTTKSTEYGDDPALAVPVDGNDVYLNTFLNFDAFLNTMGLNAPLDSIFPDLLDNSNADCGLSNVDPATRLSYLPPDAHAEDIHELKRIPCAWKVTTGQWEVLRDAIKPYEQQLGGFTLPSLLAIGRYFTGYFEDFHNHLQFLHPVTYRPQDLHDSPELTLAVAAIGAVSRYEREAGVRMFHAAMTIVHSRWRQSEAGYKMGSMNDENADMDSERCRTLRTVQAAVLLTAFAVMEGNYTTQDTMPLHHILVDYATADEYTRGNRTDRTDWTKWIYTESVRRTKCAIFNVMNMHTIILDSPPALPSSRFNTYLPCSTLEWTAQNENDWRLAQQLAPEPQTFQQAYSDLFTTTTSQSLLHSPFGNLVLVNAVLQRIHLARQMQFTNDGESLRPSDLHEITAALERWTQGWRQAPEAIFDPRNPDGSNSFAASSLLGLAFVRLHTTYASSRVLREWQPKTTGLSLANAHMPRRGTNITAALLHCTQAFAVPVKFGMEVTSRRQFHHWDLLNFVWHLEASTFLSKWLLNVTTTCQSDSVSDFESRLMSIIHSLVNKAEESLGSRTLFEPVVTVDRDTATLARNLNNRLAKLWSRLYKRHNSPWALTDLIGGSLEEYEKAIATL